MVVISEDYLSHYGTPRKSGRYPWGSGGNAVQDNKTFLDYVNDLKRRLGWSDKQIAEGMGISTTQLRAKRSIAVNEQRQQRIGQAQALKDKGYSNVAAAAKMGIPESTYRSLIAPGAKDKADLLTSTADMLKKEVADNKYIDVGKGVESHIGVSNTRLKTAVAMLQEEGYEVRYIKTPQIGTGKETTVKVLTAPGVPYAEVSQNRALIRQPNSFSDDAGRTFGSTNHPPLSVDPKRVDVRYAADGGAEADGVIYVRPGVDDISLGGSSYAQVRVKVGDGHYLKGMAMYKDDLPDGVDLLFNTNKDDTGNKLDSMKALSDDPDLPFGAITRPLLKNQGKPNESVASAMNVVNEEGDWSNWSKSLSSQMLSKQSPKLAKEQLNMTFERRQKEYDDIMALTNPTVRKKLLEEFADGTDAAAVHLKAAALPRQGSHVILPVSSLSSTEIYAPQFRDGEPVVLIRHPHGGTFEIPELRVNNKNAEARKLLGNAKDAVGINSKVAERLSGADFDGDTVLVIPNARGKVKTSPALEGLKNFDPRSSYPAYEGMKPMSARTKQLQMGDVSNLITDMTIRQATHSEIARAVRHSMVVIDAEKHNLNYKQSALDNNIKQLKEKYQGSSNAGASTLVSRASSQTRVPDRTPRRAADGGPIDRATGKKVYTPTGKTYVNRKGETKPSTTKSKKLAETDDAFTLSSGTPIETVYANHSNSLKSLANTARKQAVTTPRATYSRSAAKAYKPAVDSLNSKLTVALRNAPLERQAQLLANSVVRAKKESNPDLTPESIKKIKNQALTEARSRTGAKKQRVVITPSEWEAIQAGAISDTKLSSILSNADMDVVRDLATPRTKLLMSPSKSKRAASMLSAGYTRAQVADALGVSLTTLDDADVL